VEELTPVELTETPWLDPWDGLYYGVYRVRLPNQPPDEDDHQVVYLRAVADDPTGEYKAPTTICGKGLEGAFRPERITGTCRACMAGGAAAFGRAPGERAERSIRVAELPSSCETTSSDAGIEAVE
jgi:hypothetical protein